MKDGRGMSRVDLRKINVSAVRAALSKNHDLTQKELAEKVDLSIPTVRSICRELAAK